jgi:protein SCO1/2
MLASLIGACDHSAPKFQNTDITGATYARDFKLTDHHGVERTLADFQGKAVILFFGFTQCPDVCPTTLSELKAVMQALGTQADRVQVLFVTLDPARDTQAVLAQYIPAFDTRFLGMYTDAEGTLKIAKDFKVYFEKRPGSTPENYTIDHTAASFVFDPQGRIRLYVKHDQLATLTQDLPLLLQGK